MSEQPTISIWECNKCGALYSKDEACYCSRDIDGNPTMLADQECIKIGDFTSKELKKTLRFKLIETDNE